MIRTLFATTALATLLATGAYAQEATTTAPATTADPAAPMTQEAAPAMKAEGHLASQIIGENVYNSTADDAEHIGDVTDIVIDPEGNIQAVVVGVGGFLGLGQKDVAVDFTQLDWAERDGDRWLVAAMSKEQLEQQAEFDRSMYEPAPAQTTAANDPALAPGAATVPADPAASGQMAEGTTADPAAPAADSTMDQTTTAAIDRSTLTELPADKITADELIGTTVYGSNDADVGDISDVVLTADGKIDAYIVDVGGFLGLGAKPVAIGSDKLAFMTDADGNKYLYTDFTKEQLEAAPAYDKDTFAEKRDEQRLMVQ